MWRFLKKLEIELPYDLAIPLLGIHTEETRSERDTCTPMFISFHFDKSISYLVVFLLPHLSEEQSQQKPYRRGNA